jgi:hypothetical protein
MMIIQSKVVGCMLILYEHAGMANILTKESVHNASKDQPVNCGRAIRLLAKIHIEVIL